MAPEIYEATLARANTTEIGVLIVASLMNGTGEIKTFSWNTSTPLWGNYVLQADAWSAQGETNLDPGRTKIQVFSVFASTNLLPRLLLFLH